MSEKPEPMRSKWKRMGGLAVTTTDGGATWSAISGTPNYNYNTVHYTNFSNVPAIYFGADQSSGLVVEKYSAGAWSAFTINVSGTNTNPAEDITRLVMSDAANGSFVSATGNVYYLSYQSGTSDWIAALKLSAATPDKYVDLCTATSATTLFALTKQGKANTTSNSGSTWSSTNNVFGAATSEFTSVAFNGTNLVGVGTKGLIMDYNFSAVNDRTNNTHPLPLNDVYMDATGAAWACGQNGTVLKGTNNFGAWSFATVPSAETQNFNSVLVDGSNAIVAGEGSNIITIDANTLAASAHTSATAEIKTDLFTASTGDLYASAKNGVLVTSGNGGSSWSAVSGLSAFAGKDFASVSSFGNNPILAVGEAGTIARYNGSAWSSSTAIAPPSINAAYMLSSTTGYAVGNGGNIFYTNDGGVTWSNPTSPTPNNLNAIYFVSPTNGFAAGDAGTLIHFNGTAWSSVTSITPGISATLNDIYFADATHGIIVGAAGTELITSNGGANWTSTTISSSDLNAVYMTGSMAVAVGNSGVVYRSADYGATFSAGTSNTTENLNDVSFIDNYTGYIAGNNSVVLKTIDGGITWTNANTNLAPGTNVNTIAYGGSYQFMLGGAGAYTLNDQNDIYSSQFFFDKLGRLVASQNAKQAKILTNSSGKKYMRYSYTVYDALGRISEVGEVNKAAVGSGNPILFNPDAAFLNGSSFPFPATGIDPNHTYTKTQITKTTYDFPTCTTAFGFTQENLRKRASSSSVDDDGDGVYEYATHYSYDIHGNVKTLVQDNPLMTGILASQRYKRIDYEYDLIGGKVNKVIYQGTKDANGNYPLDRFYHKYEYDADNRLNSVYTSKDNLLWDHDAKYFYYKHGLVARTEIGDLKVQGTDYAYTIQGWIKSVNAGILDENADMGMDGLVAGSSQQYLPGQADVHAKIGRDAFGYNLGYFTNDYKPVVNSLNVTTIAGNFASSANDLFNSNIRHMVTAIKNPMGGDLPVQGTSYIYDQLNRIREMNAFRDMNGSIDNIKETNSFATAPVSNAYHEQFDYDANGNIQHVQRNNDAGVMQDDFTYQYDWVDASDHTKGTKNNRLYHVNDAASSSVATDDIDDEGTFTPSDPSDPNKVNELNNYSYDEIGNLKSDVQEGIENIEWTVFGKIKKIVRKAGFFKIINGQQVYPSNMEFLYDSEGNRVYKIIKPRDAGGEKIQSQWIYTYYIRDGQGNVMTTYNSTGLNDLHLKEQHLYGNSRLGISEINEDMLAITSSNSIFSRTLGNKNFELSNHLDNILAVISDKKIAHSTNGTDIDYYAPTALSAKDYYAFGSPMPGRNFNPNKTRYGFNGKENDNETVGTGEGSQDYGMRIYNPSLGKFFSVDPISSKYPELSTYHFASNSPLSAIDLDGQEAKVVTYGQKHKGTGDDGHISNCASACAKKLGVTAQPVATGKNLLSVMASSSGTQTISAFIFYGHSWNRALFLENNSGFYQGNRTADGEGAANFEGLLQMSSAGNIKFSKHVIFIFASCGTAGDGTGGHTPGAKGASKFDGVGSFAGTIGESIGKNYALPNRAFTGQYKVTVIGATDLTHEFNDGTSTAAEGVNTHYYKIERVYQIKRQIVETGWWIFKTKSFKDTVTLIDSKTTDLGNKIDPAQLVKEHNDQDTQIKK